MDGNNNQTGVTLLISLCWAKPTQALCTAIKHGGATWGEVPSVHALVTSLYLLVVAHDIKRLIIGDSYSSFDYCEQILILAWSNNSMVRWYEWWLEYLGAYSHSVWRALMIDEMGIHCISKSRRWIKASSLDCDEGTVAWFFLWWRLRLRLCIVGGQAGMIEICSIPYFPFEISKLSMSSTIAAMPMIWVSGNSKKYTNYLHYH